MQPTLSEQGRKRHASSLEDPPLVQSSDAAGQALPIAVLLDLHL